MNVISDSNSSVAVSAHNIHYESKSLNLQSDFGTLVLALREGLVSMHLQSCHKPAHWD
jgi:hypothetical protein